jgi:hypothetical protein
MDRSRRQAVCDLLLGGTQVELVQHQLGEDRLVLFGQDDPGEERFQGQAEIGHTLLALPHMVDEPVDTVVFFGVFESQLLVLPQTSQVVEAVLQPEFVPQVGRDDFHARAQAGPWGERGHFARQRLRDFSTQGQTGQRLAP